MESPAPEGPLDGLVVLDFTRVIAGPVCTRLLADLGATVVKLEEPTGDAARQARPLVEGVSASFSHFNAGKQSVVVDLATDRGVAVAQRLARRADVIVENFRAGVMSRWGLDAETLRADRPELVYCSISGYGQDGPWADRRAYAPVVQGEMGWLWSIAARRGEPVRQEAQSHGDIYTGLMGANAVLAALVRRGIKGTGAHLDVTLAEALTWCNEWIAPELAGDTARSVGPSTAPVLETADGSAVTTTGNPCITLPAWARALDRPDLMDDPRLATVPGRLEHRDEVVALLTDAVRAVPDPDELERVAGRERLVVGRVRTLDEAMATEFARARALLGRAGPVLVPARPWGGDGVGLRGPAPGLGEHTRAVLATIGAYPIEEIEHLLDAGIVSASESDDASAQPSRG